MSMFCRSLFVILSFFSATVVSVLRFTDSDSLVSSSSSYFYLWYLWNKIINQQCTLYTRSIFRTVIYNAIRVLIMRICHFEYFYFTFNNISVISWRSALVVEETRVPGENYRPAESHRQFLSHNVVSNTLHQYKQTSYQVKQHILLS